MGRSHGTHGCPRIKERRVCGRKVNDMHSQAGSAAFGDTEFPLAKAVSVPLLWRCPPGGRIREEVGSVKREEIRDIYALPACPLPWVPRHKSAYF